MATGPNATKSTWQIYAVANTGNLTKSWQITNLLTGDIFCYPISLGTFSMQVNSDTDYNFIFNRNKLDQLQFNILDVKYIGNGSGTPNYGAPNTDYASIIALS